MEKSYAYNDCLTGLNNENFLNSEYKKYLEKYPDSYFVMIDFKKFKRINDIYGHSMGDRYLILFSEILKIVFDDSLIIRLHGDEFCVLTKYDADKIIKCFELCNKKIGFMSETGNIPEKFNFNVGLVKAEMDMEKTKTKADYMMYYAKKNNRNYQVFNDEIWSIQLGEEQFIANINKSIKEDSFTYFGRKLHNLSNDSIITEISTRDINGNSIFHNGNYSFLREKQQLRKIDMYNLDFLLSRISLNVDGNILINLDYKSIINEPNLIEYLKMLIDINKFNSKQIILSINFNGISQVEMTSTIEVINLFKQLGFKISIDKFNSFTTDFLWENAPIDFLKVDCYYWKKGLENIKIARLLDAKIDAFSKNSETIPLFTCIETETQYSFVKSLSCDEKFVSGNYIEEEQKIKIK